MLCERDRVRAHGGGERVEQLLVAGGLVDALAHHVAAVPVAAHAVEEEAVAGDDDGDELRPDRSSMEIIIAHTRFSLDRSIHQLAE